MTAAGQHGPPFQRLFPLGSFNPFVGFSECVIWALFEGKKKFWKRLASRVVYKNNDDGADYNASDVEQPTKPFPPASFRIIKNWMRHAYETKNILAVG